MKKRLVTVPSLVRIKPGALDRIGVYAKRGQFRDVALFFNKELDADLIDRVKKALSDQNISVAVSIPVESSSYKLAQISFEKLPSGVDAVIGIGGGKALDVAKYVAFLASLPYIASPTALSNDAFCSPQSSLELEGKRRSFAAAMPYGVVVDTQVCLKAPRILWMSGIGDSVAKITSVYDWKLAFKIKGTQIDDLAAILSDATVYQLIAKPDHDLEGVKLLAGALMFNGVAMELCGSSRPASGSEHLISHALDLINSKPRYHGLQVGVATYMVSLLQGQGTRWIKQLFNATGFWDAIKEDPFIKEDWIKAFDMAPTMKGDFYTILSEKNQTPELIKIMETDPLLSGVFC